MRGIRSRTIALGLFVALIGTYTLLALCYPIAYIWATYEDLFGEWMQFWFFVATLVFAARIALLRSRYRWFFVVLALGCFYVAMEEISWGQRILGISTPEFLKEHNLQGEINFHNLLTGPYSTVLKDTIAYCLAGALALYGFAYPLARPRLRIAQWLDRVGVAPPPLFAAPFFLTAAILELGPLSFNEAEIAELAVGCALMIMSIQYAMALPEQLEPLSPDRWSIAASRRLTARMVIATALVINFAALTTLAIYATPSGRDRSDRRIANGVEKFAGRYSRHGFWTTAAGLYERIHAEQPNSRSTMRKLAACYRELGEMDRFHALLHRAIEIDLNRHAQDPGAASVCRSLVRTYRMLQDGEEAVRFMNKAVAIGEDRLARHPTSSSAAYSMGRTLELMFNYKEAFEQFQRAVDLKPTSKRYRKAYYRAQKRLRETEPPNTEQTYADGEQS